jgi:hypothetical protein
MGRQQAEAGHPADCRAELAERFHRTAERLGRRFGSGRNGAMRFARPRIETMLDATPLLRGYARYRLRGLSRDPVRTQVEQLMRLVSTARATRFGTAHRFGDIGSVAEYQRRVPVRDYDAFWKEWWEPGFPRLRDATWPGLIPYFAKSSGTSTGVTKYIPVSRQMVRANRRAALDALVFHVRARPRSRVLGGKSLVLGGTTELASLAPGVRTGDLSGIAASEVPLWARTRFFPDRELALAADWDRKIDQIARRSLQADIRSLSGTPSWMLLFFERLASIKPGGGGLADFYPALELVIHGGVSFTPYRKTFAGWLEGSRAETREVYPASEGFFAVADGGPDDALRLLVDNGIFYEFVPIDSSGEPVAAERHWLETAEIGANYALAVTTNAGLWSYLVGDTVSVVSRNPARIAITGRLSYWLSAFGEHLTGAEIETAVSAAADALGLAVADFAVVPIYPDASGARGGHLYLVEFRDGRPGAAQQERFARIVDETLVGANADYAEHRHGDFGMLPPRVRALAPGTFAEWMRRRGRLGGQNKVPRVIHDGDLQADLLRLAETN